MHARPLASPPSATEGSSRSGRAPSSIEPVEREVSRAPTSADATRGGNTIQIAVRFRAGVDPAEAEAAIREVVPVVEGFPLFPGETVLELSTLYAFEVASSPGQTADLILAVGALPAVDHACVAPIRAVRSSSGAV